MLGGEPFQALAELCFGEPCAHKSEEMRGVDGGLLLFTLKSQVARLSRDIIALARRRQAQECLEPMGEDPDA